jgi:hypothetical protein
MGNSNRSEIGKLLRGQLDHAQVEYLAARTRLELLEKNTSIDLPHADGELHIQQSRLESKTALRKYSLALKRFTDFNDSGIVPEDL